MNRNLPFAAPVAACLLAAAPASAQTPAPVDTSTPEKVMSAFHAAVVAHDGARLSTLFLPDGTAWFNVLSDQALARARLKSPGAPKVRASTYQAFAEFVSKSKADFDPRHTDVKVFSDGTIAMAYFSFSFLIDGKEQNKGAETWQLVKAQDGWRIAAITYSSDPGS